MGSLSLLIECTVLKGWLTGAPTYLAYLVYSAYPFYLV